jgi:hypothetical protein
MPKEIKGNAGRKPPEPSANHSDIDDWFQRQMPHLQPLVQGLDESIRATVPGLHYAVKWKRPYYGSGSRRRAAHPVGRGERDSTDPSPSGGAANTPSTTEQCYEPLGNGEATRDRSHPQRVLTDE